MVTFRNNNNVRRNNFRRNDRNFKSNGDRPKFGSNYSNNDNFKRKAPGRNNHNAPKLIEKYNDLAREASSNGDKILSENYLQHADHFTRILNEQENYKKLKFAENKPTENTTQTQESFDKSEEIKTEDKKIVAEIKPISKKKTKADSHHFFSISNKKTFTHIKFNIFPDGGVARLRLYGSITKSHNFKNKKINLASLLDGASVVACNNEHFGKAENILAGGKAVNISQCQAQIIFGISSEIIAFVHFQVGKCSVEITTF